MFFGKSHQYQNRIGSAQTWLGSRGKYQMRGWSSVTTPTFQPRTWNFPKPLPVRGNWSMLPCPFAGTGLCSLVRSRKQVSTLLNLTRILVHLHDTLRCKIAATPRPQTTKKDLCHLIQRAEIRVSSKTRNRSHFAQSIGVLRNNSKLPKRQYGAKGMRWVGDEIKGKLIQDEQLKSQYLNTFVWVIRI